MKLVGKKPIISRAPITVKMRSSSYQRNTYRELDPINNVFPTQTMLFLHQGTNTMYANMPVATPKHNVCKHASCNT